MPMLYAATARDIWEAVKKLYSSRQNGARLYALRKQVHECKQGTMDVTAYFNQLSVIWQEMDLCRDLNWSCPCGEVLYYNKFDVVRSRILGTRPVPSLMEVCSEIRLEKDRSNSMNNPVTKSPDSAAFKVLRTDKQNGKVPPVCEHYKKPGTLRSNVGSFMVVLQMVKDDK
ncbi:uncharacterized protein LOC120073640 [Benincasa hispida]|uniref:uncharacterized protein LOC120073640 n=1 Tax=Benincasa hispida TaxID=102211 RepID=UPI001900F50F|nr:uncharacterized protein LOC120073640 [Benincasa hispida]